MYFNEWLLCKQTNKQTSKQTKKLVFISKNEWANDNEVAPQRRSFFDSKHDFSIRLTTVTLSMLVIAFKCKYTQNMLGRQFPWLYFIFMSDTSFKENPRSIVCLNVKELLPLKRCRIWSLNDSNRIWTHTHLVCKQTLKHLAKLVKWLSSAVSTYLCGAFGCMVLLCRTSFRVNPHSIVCLNVKELLAQSRLHIWSFSDRNGIYHWLSFDSYKK